MRSVPGMGVRIVGGRGCLMSEERGERTGDEPGGETLPPAVDVVTAMGGLCAPLTYVYGESPPRFAFDMPKFTAVRGDIHFNVNDTPSVPPTKWQKRKWRWKARRSNARERIALFIAPWLEDDPYEW